MVVGLIKKLEQPTNEWKMIFLFDTRVEQDWSNAPAPRLCHVIKWNESDGFGFHLLADKKRKVYYNHRFCTSSFYCVNQLGGENFCHFCVCVSPLGVCLFVCRANLSVKLTLDRQLKLLD